MKSFLSLVLAVITVGVFFCVAQFVYLWWQGELLRALMYGVLVILYLMYEVLRNQVTMMSKMKTINTLLAVFGKR